MKLNYKTIIGGVFLAALAIRVTVMAVMWPNLDPEVDIDWYRSLGRSLAAGQGFAATSPEGRTLPNVSRMPLYPVVLAGLQMVGGDRLGLYLATQCLMGAATCALTVVLARRWLPWSGAALAGGLMAVDPVSVKLCSVLLTETLLALLLVAAACVWAWHRDSRWGWAGMAAFMGLAALTRSICVWLWVPVLAVGWLTRTDLRRLGIFLVVFFAAVSFWMARNATVTGRWFITTTGREAILLSWVPLIEAQRTGSSPHDIGAQFVTEYGWLDFFDNPTDFAERWRRYGEVGAQYLRRDPLWVVKQTVFGSVKLLIAPGKQVFDPVTLVLPPPARWWPHAYSLGLAVLVVAAARATWHRRREVSLLAAVVFYVVLLAGGPTASSRFRAPVFPLLVTLGVIGFTSRSQHAD